jgi:long-chain acyl-CoA synthetase
MNLYPNNFIETFAKASSHTNSKKIFIELSSTKISYGETCKLICKLTALYKAWELKPGDRIVFATKNDLHASILFLSLLINGITAIIIDPNTKKLRAESLLQISQPQGIILDTDIYAAWQPHGDYHILQIDLHSQNNFLSNLFKSNLTKANPESYPLILNKYEPAKIPNFIDPNSDAYILFTSGTTSKPKGVRISHKALVTHLKTLSHLFKYGQESRILNILHLSHTDGIIQGPVIAFFNIAQLLRPLNFSIPAIPELLDTIYRYRITHFITVPTILSLIMKFGIKQKDAFQTEDFQFIISNGSQLEAALWETFEKTFNTRLVNVFGLTETVVGGLFSGPDDRTHNIGTIGKPIDCEAKIITTNGDEAKIGEPGELLIKGANIMSGYLNAPEATAEAFIDNWLCTGDIAIRDTAGFYKIVGRKKSIIKSRGITIHPEEITEVLNNHPDVIQATTFGVQDKAFGERIVSAVAVGDSKITSNMLVAFCREHLEEIKVPNEILIFSDLPKLRSEKISIATVKALALNNEPQKPNPDNNLTTTIFDIASSSFKVPVESLSLSATPDSVVGWDSLTFLTFITNLEQQFKLEFALQEIMKMDTLFAVKTIIENKLNEIR